jgi:PAS domain S-box-containing protein
MRGRIRQGTRKVTKTGMQYIGWEAIFNAIGDAIFVADNDNVIVSVNKAFADLVKMKAEKIVGMKCYKLLHKSDSAWPGCPFEKSKRDKRTHMEEVNDPNIGVPLLVTTSPIFSPSGEMAGVVHVSKDVTNAVSANEELKRKIEELERFQRVTVGRELKMKELKARIAELESGLGEKSGAPGTAA